MKRICLMLAAVFLFGCLSFAAPMPMPQGNSENAPGHADNDRRDNDRRDKDDRKDDRREEKNEKKHHKKHHRKHKDRDDRRDRDDRGDRDHDNH